MKISFLILAIVLYVVRESLSSSLQVGTVLFTTTDLVKKCWTEKDKSLLKARLIMQDVLPDPDCIDYSKPKAIVVLLDYFRSCYNVVSGSCNGDEQNVMFLALSDALGGYLRAFILPLIKRAYYAGQIKYSDAKKLFILYDDIRSFLKTNGIGWAKPQKLCPFKYKLKPLVMSNSNGQDACRHLYTIEKKGKVCCVTQKCKLKETDSDFQKKFSEVVDNPQKDSSKFSKRQPKLYNKEFEVLDRSNPKEDKNSNNTLRKTIEVVQTTPEKISEMDDLNQRLNKFRQLKTDTSKYNGTVYKNVLDMFFKNENMKAGKSENNQQSGRKIRSQMDCNVEDESGSRPTKIIIPLPVLDDCSTPHTIAVPFKTRPLRSLHTQTSAFVLEHYYSSVIKCLVSKSKTSRDIRKFNGQFHSWLVSHVCPHLSDEQWYPAFGGVLRVMETIRHFGAENSKKDPVSHDIAFMFKKGFRFDESDKRKPSGKDTRDVGEVVSKFPQYNRYYLFAILIISTAWLFTFCACLFYLQAMKCRTGANAPPPEKDFHSPKKDKLVNLKFLIRFFKKKEPENVSSEETFDQEAKNQWRKQSMDQKPKQIQKEDSDCPSVETNTSGHDRGDDKTKKKIETKHKEKGQLVVTGEGDIPAFIISNAEVAKQPLSTSAPTWPSRSSYIRFEKVGHGVSSTSYLESSADAKVDDKIRMIWKKPSDRFKRSLALKEFEDGSKSMEDSSGLGVTETGASGTRTTVTESGTTCTEDGRKDYSTEKRSSCSYCGSCSQSGTTSTVSSTQTQVEGRFSSATMEFFEHVIAKHKSSGQDSTETETEDDSYSSQTED